MTSLRSEDKEEDQELSPGPLWGQDIWEWRGAGKEV